MKAFEGLAASGSTVVVPANTGDVGAMVAQAMAIYQRSTASLPGSLAAGAGAAEGFAAGEDAGVGGPGREGVEAAASEFEEARFGEAADGAAAKPEGR